MNPKSPAFDACVIGAGPAGCTLAIKLTQLGLKVALIERAKFPRAHLGESLSPGVRPMLSSIGASHALENAGFRAVHRVHIRWDQGAQIREDPEGRGIIVDRAHFDAELLGIASEVGVRIFQPASVKSNTFEDDRWTLRLETPDGPICFHSRFLCEATGRARFLAGNRVRNGAKTLAVYAYWRGAHLPSEPKIEAGKNAWFWGVPLPDNTYNTLAFVDPKEFRGLCQGSLTARFQGLLSESGLFTGCGSFALTSPIRAVDATPYLAENVVTPNWIRVGDAALALDPISSSGVQKAIQSALSGALVVNTLLRRPANQEAAIQFHTHSLSKAALKHRTWASEHYQSVFSQYSGAFWKGRASWTTKKVTAAKHPHPAPLRLAPKAQLSLSPELTILSTPCLTSEFVEFQSAISLPSIMEPVAYIGGVHLASLLLQLPPVIEFSELSSYLASMGGGTRSEAIANWLVQNGVMSPI